jgi:addiction module RelE/StbE family toxin
LAALIYAAQALADLERLTDFLIAQDPQAALDTIGLIEEAVAILRRHPDIGRPAEEGMRELVISRGRIGYLALYDIVEAEDTVLILAIRHRREAGYPES